MAEMNFTDLRELIQSYLNEIEDIDCGAPIPDGMVEEGKTYFGYELQQTFRGSDINNRYTMQIDLTGRLVRKENTEENTLKIMDEALEELKGALKQMNFKYSYNDVSFQDGIRKILVKANGRYNEANKEIV